MNVLLANWYYKPMYGGVENSIYHLAQTFLEKKHHPVILASNVGPSRNIALSSYTALDGIDVWRFQAQDIPAALRSVVSHLIIHRAAQMIREIHRIKPIDVVVARHHLLSLAARKALPDVPTVYVIPIVLSRGNPLLFSVERAAKWYSYFKVGYQKWFISPLDVCLQNRAFHKSTHLVVLSSNMAQQVVAENPEYAKSTTIIPPGVDVRRFSPSPDRDMLRKQMGFSENDFICLVLGRFSRQKRFDVALHALAQYPQYNLPTLLLVGDGPEVPKLKALAEQLSLGDKVHFCGPSTAVERYYQIADIFLLTSQYEAFGQTVLEAMASSVPVVAFRPNVTNKVVTASSELIEDKINGWLCDFSAAALANAIAHAHNMPREQLNSMGVAARQSTLSKYSWAKFCDAILDIILPS